MLKKLLNSIYFRFISWLHFLHQAYNPWDGVFGRKSSAAGSITGVRKSGGVTKVDTVVVGSGISGATAAYYLHSKGINVLLTEAKDEVGGNLISKKGSYFCYSAEL